MNQHLVNQMEQLSQQFQRQSLCGSDLMYETESQPFPNQLANLKKSLQTDPKTTPKKKSHIDRSPQLNIFSSCSTTTSSRCESTEDFKCPEKAFLFTSIHIDNNDDFEQRIHEWLEKQNVVITDPYDKVADYYHNARIQALNKFADCIQHYESESVDSIPLTKPLSRASSNLVMSSSPIIQRRNKILSSETRSDFRLNHSLLRDSQEVSVKEFSHA